MRHTEYWTTVLTLSEVISSAYCDLHHWRSNQQTQKTEPKPYHWATGLHRTQAVLMSLEGTFDHFHQFKWSFDQVLAGFSRHGNSIKMNFY